MKWISCAVMAVVLTILAAPSAYAHGVSIHEVERGTVEVTYDDGSISKRMVVTVMDESGKELKSGKLDTEGRFQYGHPDAYKLVANDGIGHQAEWVIGEEASDTTHTYRWVIISGIVVVFAAIAIVFARRNKLRRSEDV